MQKSTRADASAPGALRPGVAQRQQSAGPAAGKTSKGAQPAKKKQASGAAEVSLHPCSAMCAFPDDGVASAALDCATIEQQAGCRLSPFNSEGTAGCFTSAAGCCSFMHSSANQLRSTAQQGCLPSWSACLNSTATTCRARLPRPRAAQHRGLWPQQRATRSLESSRARRTPHAH